MTWEMSSHSSGSRPKKAPPDGLPAARLFLVDQLEDLFTLHPERWRDRAGFFEQIAEALDDDECLRVVLVIRDEYVAALDPYRTVLPGGLRARFRVREGDSVQVGRVRRPSPAPARLPDPVVGVPLGA